MENNDEEEELWSDYGQNQSKLVLTCQWVGTGGEEILEEIK